MLFDLRGRGRRRSIQVIYLSLAILMGGGLVLFGIGGNTSGGLFDAFSGDQGTGGANEAVTKRIETLEKRTQANPSDAAAWSRLASVRFQTATSGENYDQVNQAYTDKGRAQLRAATAAWERHLALNPPKADATVATQMVQAYGPNGLRRFDRAVGALELVIDSRDPTSGLYAQLAVLAHAAKQARKSTLAEDKAVELAPDKQGKDVRAQIQLAKTQLDNQAGAGQPQAG